MRFTFNVVDVETNGLTPAENELIEVGAVRVEWLEDHFEITKHFHTLISPHHMPPFNIQNLTGITPQILSGAPPFEEVAHDFVKFLGDDMFIAHNVFFDIKVINGNLKKIGLDEINPPLVDSQNLISMVYPTLENHKLNAVARALDFKLKDSHRALDDAQVTAEIVIKCLEDISRYDYIFLEELERILKSTSLPIKKLFQFIKEIKIQRGEKVEPFNHFHQLVHPYEDFGDKVKKAEALIQKLDPEEVDGYFLPGGALSKMHQAYEMRHEQLEMVQWVTQAFNEGKPLFIEAGTGTGKSLAYLIPAVLFAKLNQVPVVISTRTKNLQDQLMDKDIPLLKKILPFEFNALVMKGRENYVCLRKMEELFHNIEKKASPLDRLNALPLLTWLQQTKRGDLGELHPSLATRFGDRLSSQAKTSLNERCRYFEGCYGHGIRREAKKADIIITNHNLLFADIMAENHLLPEYAHVILDEGHHLEDAATDAFSFTLSSGVFMDAFRHYPETLLSPSLVPKAEMVKMNVHDLFSAFKNLIQENLLESAEDDQQLILDETIKSKEIWNGIQIILRDLNRKLKNFILEAREHLETYDDLKVTVDARGVLATLDGYWQLLDSLSRPAPDFVLWLSAEAGKEIHRIQLHGAMVDVSALIFEKLFKTKRTVVVTSATLKVRNAFEYVLKRYGLLNATAMQFEMESVGSPFKLEEQMRVYLPQDIPDITAKNSYIDYVGEFLIDLFERTKGRALVLFTSYRMMEKVYSRIRVPTEKMGLHLLAQGKHGSRRAILNRFKEVDNGILLGTDSFWEGIDIPGNQLSCLVIQKLPFSVPSEPVFAARMKKLADEGTNAFMEYALPKAMMKFRQGLGRLIRTKTDKGVVVLLDSRMWDKNYGALFREMIPPSIQIKGNKKTILEQAEEFLS
jgi:ATP-dependent DNA helicase DinG